MNQFSFFPQEDEDTINSLFNRNVIYWNLQLASRTFQLETVRKLFFFFEIAFSILEKVELVEKKEKNGFFQSKLFLSIKRL
jgi:hypothetical protein